MAIKEIKDKPYRPLEIDLTGANANVIFLCSYVAGLCEKLGYESESIINDIKISNLENAIDIFDYYFGDHVIIYI